MHQVPRPRVMAVKALASLHILHRLAQAFVTVPGSNGDLCTVYVSSKVCSESAPVTTTGLQPSVGCIIAPKMFPVHCNKIPQ